MHKYKGILSLHYAGCVGLQASWVLLIALALSHSQHHQSSHVELAALWEHHCQQ